MHTPINIGTEQDFDLAEIKDMYRLRARVFGERMGWEVTIFSGMEIDEYDALSPYYLIVRNSDGQLCGCVRIMPTEGPYMLKNTFPELLSGHVAPENPHIWELSRFAIRSDSKRNFGFTELVVNVMRELDNFANRMNISRYVIVTTTAIERLLKHIGIEMYRFGPPRRIGVEKTVALTIEVSERTHHVLFGDAEETV